MKWYHIHVFRWTGEVDSGLICDWRKMLCRCGQTRIKAHGL